MKTLTGVDLEGLGEKRSGKVRDYYEWENKLILVTTDRISAFDRVLGTIPNKGQVLNQLSAFWFEKTEDIVANHMIATPDPNVMVAKKCQAYPIEMVVRGYISGVTKTSLWNNYSLGKRKIYGINFPSGLKKNQKLKQAVITPTTRGTGPGGHDEKITREEILARKIIPKKVYERMEKVALKLFKRGQEVCEKVGLILVDTKYEFGDNHGELTLIDEIHTPDSSRFWIRDTYRERWNKGLEPDNFDKEFFRLWYAENNYSGDGTPPEMPAAYRKKVSQRYIELYEKVTGKEFVPNEGKVVDRIKKNLKPLMDQVIIVVGSEKDKDFVAQIEAKLRELQVSYSVYFASAHKQPRKVLAILERYQNLGTKVVAITVAGRSNALSGFVAANSDLATIACPPFKDMSDYLVNIHSSLQMPSQVPVMTVIDPGNAALAADRILKIGK